MALVEHAKKLGSGTITLPNINADWYSISAGNYMTEINVEDYDTLTIGTVTFNGATLSPTVYIYGGTTVLGIYNATQSNLSFDVSTYTTVQIIITGVYNNNNGSQHYAAQVTGITIL